MEEIKTETLDLSRRGLKKIEKAPPEETQGINSLILDQNELQRLDNIDAYSRLENLSICNNFLLRMHGVSRLTNLRILSLNNNGILQIEGLKDLIYLKVLKLAGNNIKSIEHLNHNMHLEHLDLSNNQISFIADISYLKGLKHLNLERNRIVDLRQCDRYLPPNLEHLGLGHNNIVDLNEISHLVHLSVLESFSVQGNPCVAMAGKDKLGFDYRPFVLNWILSVKTIDGFVVSAIESLKAEWLYSQGKGRHFHAGQHQELCEYLATTCPLTADALETEDQRKLRLVLSKVTYTLLSTLSSYVQDIKFNASQHQELCEYLAITCPLTADALETEDQRKLRLVLSKVTYTLLSTLSSYVQDIKFNAGQYQELCEYLATTCPLTADALETEDQRKLRLVLSKVTYTLLSTLSSYVQDIKFNAGQYQELCEYLATTCPLTADALETEDQRKLRLVLSKVTYTLLSTLSSYVQDIKFNAGQYQELCKYLATTCPLTADALETEDQRKLRLVLSKAQHHQQQLKDHQTHSPMKSKLQSPRMQSRISTPRHMGRSPDRLSSSYHPALSKNGSPSHQMSMSCSGEIPSGVSRGFDSPQNRSFDSPGIVEKDKMTELSKPANQALEAASKMVPVPESLMSPDYQDPIYDIQRSIPRPANSSPSSNGSLHDEKPKTTVKNLKGSPRLPKSATSSPKLKSKMEQRKGSLTNSKEINGLKDQIDSDKLEIIKLASNQRRQKKLSAEATAAVTIQKMWRGYRSRNLNKDTLRILHAIQAARARQHIQRLTCDMEATKAALESERKIQQLQMQAINALWKKVSTLQASDTQKKSSDCDDNTDVLRQLTETCFSLQAQVVELQGCMQEVLKAVSGRSRAAPVATQTDITAVATPQEERSAWLRRPQTLSLSASSAPDPPTPPTVASEREQDEKSTEAASLGIERTESVIEENVEAGCVIAD